ncbi:hypothetical protein QBC32DRAFT_252360 [Pseudoneurospora amorphoporcata]|uniref:E3 ubiquitin-protein ligase CHIP n=1 Tax=Pseudoneurospora amorphoporcata TaxID=241081 RepID=A0AAN6P561_9PEZI|nr:hypothetical protein QBC32DRAFT_252360 [Pseudoneurospora amorphoporcata]
MSAQSSLALKEEGNRHFQRGDYVAAEALYTKAIIADPTNPLLYTNRAMARLKMTRWDSVIEDCEECLRLSSLTTASSSSSSSACPYVAGQKNTGKNFKALYYLSQAHLPLKNYDQAVSYALQAHKICAETHDKSLAAVTSQVLKCKKERWEHREKLRRREEQELEGEVVELLRKDMEGLLKSNEEDEEERKEMEKLCEEKIERVKQIFEKAREKDQRRRENPPDWAIDDISFQVMVDPVMTKTGKSYERASIEEHLRRSETDPLTRTPLTIKDLVPNIDLKHACEEFLEENGWAGDW